MLGIWLSVSRLGQKLAKRLNAFVASHYDHGYTDQLIFSPINATDLHVNNQSYGPRIPVFSKWKAAQQKRKADALQSDSEDDGPRIPVFSKWKAARNSSITDGLPNAPTKKRSDASSSSSEEEDVLPPRRQMNSNKRRRMIIDSSDDDD